MNKIPCLNTGIEETTEANNTSCTGVGGGINQENMVLLSIIIDVFKLLIHLSLSGIILLSLKVEPRCLAKWSDIGPGYCVTWI